MNEPRIWTLDLGSSRAKLLAHDGRPEARARLELDSGNARDERLAEVFANERSVVAVSAVGGPERLAAWTAALEPLVQRLLIEPDPGLLNVTRTPETVGGDRLYAARGALLRYAAPLLVVDVGTAFTVDAIGAPRGESEERARFLGGAIGAGPELCARALHEACALPRVDAAWDAPALGRDTLEAVRAGTSVGVLGALRELVQRVGAEAGFVSSVPLLLTGGGSVDLDFDAFAPHPVERCPDLVHEGLFAAALDALDVLESEGSGSGA